MIALEYELEIYNWVCICLAYAIGKRGSHHLQHPLNELPAEGELPGEPRAAPQGCQSYRGR